MAAMTVALFAWAGRPDLTLADAVHTVLDVLEGLDVPAGGGDR
jgi:hypothetical protein